MTSRRAARACAAALGALTLLAGCSGQEVQERAEDVVSDAAGSASSAAVSAVRDQICRVVADNDVSATDAELLRGLVEGGEAAGVDEAVLDPARRIAEAGDQLPADAVTELRQACA